MYAKVAVAAATYSIDRPFDYHIPEEIEAQAVPGMRVFVPFGNGNRITEGIILSRTQNSGYNHCKEILRLADDHPILNEEAIKLALFMRNRYFCTVYDAVKVMIPAGYWFDKTGRRKGNDKYREMVRLIISPEEAYAAAEKKKKQAPKQAEILELLGSFESLPVKDLLHFTASNRAALHRLSNIGLVELYQKESLRRPDYGSYDRVPIPDLTEEQSSVFRDLQKYIGSHLSNVSLLAGVTGSGKTQVYAHLIKDVLNSGGGAVFLVPEIALTPQMLLLFSSWFGEEVAVLHSALSSGERDDEWKRISRGTARLVIGTRSAVFAPIKNLSLIIVDEEQEESYVSESNPRYDAREIARFRCFQNNASLVLGSATPDIGSRYLAETGKYGFFRLSTRFNAQPLPPVHIIDMKKELLNGNNSCLSIPLKAAISDRIAREEQSILFLNRRGTSKLVTCKTCGYIYKCPHCSVSMTWHANKKRMICHYCGTSIQLASSCPECGGELSFFGAGTQMLESELHQAFPDTEILRVDADTVSSRGSHRQLFERFVTDKIPIMLGTQMIAKGHNFDNVTLVGVISADQSLYSNDFRSGEKTFSLLTQVIGRAGRSSKNGEAYIQTYTPDNEIIQLAAKQDYEAFYRRELDMRKIQNAPPFYDWIALSATGEKEQTVLQALASCREMLHEMLPQDKTITILGPVPMLVVKVNDRYRYRLLLCCNISKEIRRVLSTILSICSRERNMRGISFFVENEPGP